MSSSPSTQKNLVDSAGKSISLGPLLGRGGEGAVYSSSVANLVVKVYHDPIKPSKQEKLKAMVQGQNPDLLRIATWPIDTVHDARTRTMVGFIMPKMSGFQEIHTLYSPAQRKQQFPDADWSFLVHTARNVALAIGTFHRLGHVVGDINPKNLVVSRDATVKLIDCDSFQIYTSSRKYLCEVGVPHFTPPELHGKALDTTVRNPNHDGFGLAMLCFHLLFMGRHPFAGKYQNGTADMPIEKAIREFRFAYGSSATLKQMAPPPNAPSMAMVSARMQQMFDLAFGQAGALGKRPPASDWFDELTALKQSLITCADISTHKYPRTLSECTWCSFETRAGVSFFVYTTQSTPHTTFDIDAVWATIQAVIAPGPAKLPDFTYAPRAQPFVLSPGVTLQQSIDLYRQETKRRQAAVASAAQQLGQAQTLWKQHQADKRFETKYNELCQNRDNCRLLLNQYQIERTKYEQQARDLQLLEYLKKYLIERAKINGIGPTRAATLASYGIETAADVIQSQIMAVPGFGPTLTQELLKWRKSLESSFKFDPHKLVQYQALMQLDRRLAAHLKPYQHTLVYGAGELERIRQDTLAGRQQLIQDISQHSKALAQAKADVSAIEVELRAVQNLTRREMFIRNQKLLVRMALSIVIAACLIATVASSGTWTHNLIRAYNDWQTSQTAIAIQAQFTPAIPKPTRPIIAATATSALTSTELPTSDPTPTLPVTVVATTTMISRVYELPNPKSNMIQDISEGTEVTIIGRISSSIWCKARLLDDSEGWLYCIFLKTNAPLELVPIEPQMTH